MDQRFELIKTAAFYDELEKIAEYDPELFELIKQAGIFSAVGKGLSSFAGKVPGAAKAVGRMPGRLNDAANLAVINAGNAAKGAVHGGVHRLPKALRGPVHTGLDAGVDAFKHSASSTANVGEMLHHGVELGGMGMAAHGAYAAGRAAAPYAVNAGRAVGRGVSSGVSAAGAGIQRGGAAVSAGARKLLDRARLPGPPFGAAPAMAYA